VIQLGRMISGKIILDQMIKRQNHLWQNNFEAESLKPELLGQDD
jgi:hypothetical protein